MNRADLVAKRAELVEVRKHILALLDYQGDFPDEYLIKLHDDNKYQIIHIDTQIEAYDKQVTKKAPITMHHCVLHHIEHNILEECPKCKANLMDECKPISSCPKCTKRFKEVMS